MPVVQKPILHGRDHGCGGADPIPGICNLASLMGTVSAAIIATEPLAYYKLDETSGDWADSADARDATYNSRTGTVRGVASELDEGDDSLCVGVHGPTPAAALSLSDVGNCDDPLFSIDGTAAFSATVRIRPASLPSGLFSMGICGTRDSSGYGWGLYLARDESAMGGGGWPRAMRAGGDAVGPSILALDEWVRLTLTYDGASLKLYGDDVLLDTGSYSSSLPGTGPTNLRIGCAWIAEGIGGTNAPFDGEIDSLAVWDRALSDGEVGGIVDAEAGGLPAGPEGPPGPTGATGATGPGVAAGGTTGQVLTKTSSTDYATNWQTPSGGDPATDTSVWMPLLDSDGSIVFDDTDQIIPVLIPL